MLQSLLSIALGATLGAWARWGLSVWLNPPDGPFPYGTLAANLIGGYVIGLAMAWFGANSQVSPEWKLFVITGLLGGLTTFSSFSAETMQLLLRQQYGWAATVIGSHVFGSLVMTALGIVTMRAFSQG